MARRKTLKLSTPQDCRKAISRVANMVLNEEIDHKTANTLLYACNAALNAVRTDEYRTTGNAAARTESEEASVGRPLCYSILSGGKAHANK